MTRTSGATLRALYAGLVLTVVATVAPWVDRVTGNVLAHHIRDGYPAYTQARIDAAADTWLVILTVVGALGVASWVWTIWAVRARKRWAAWAVGAMFALGTGIALSALLAKDTSGEVALAPLLGWIGMLPCAAGLAAVVTLRRRRGPHPPDDLDQRAGTGLDDGDRRVVNVVPGRNSAGTTATAVSTSATRNVAS